MIIRINDLRLDVTEIELYNNQGQKFALSTTQQGNEFKVDLSNLQNGSYFLRIEGKNKRNYIHKLLKN
jgi:hypothetical protein